MMRPDLETSLDLFSALGNSTPQVPSSGVLKGAVLSPCGTYRYKLTRTWDTSLPKVCWIMLNPSTADAIEDDPTIEKCMKFSRAWGYGGLIVVNLFAFRATDPKDLVAASRRGDDVVGLANDQHIQIALHECPKLAIAAWGAHGNLQGRGMRVLKSCQNALGGERVLHALKVNQDGTPSHPLYLLDSSTPTPYPIYRGPQP